MSKRISNKATSDNIQRALAMLKSVPDHLENIGKQLPRAAPDPHLAMDARHGDSRKRTPGGYREQAAFVAGAAILGEEFDCRRLPGQEQRQATLGYLSPAQFEHAAN